MSLELQDTLAICRQIRNNDRDSGTHYLLGYLWANTSDKEKERIYKLFKADLDLIGEK
jgi:nucleoside 2-deoxyribosyltransferase